MNMAGPSSPVFMGLFLLLLVYGVPSPVSPALSPDTLLKIDDFVTQILSCRQIVGMNLVIVRDQEVLLSKGYGLADLEQGREVNNQTLFGIASLTKAFTSTLLAKVLQQDGRYTWDTPVREILGEDFYFYDDLRTQKMTLKDLVSHKTGIGSNNYMRLQRPTREQLAQKMRYFQPYADLRTTFTYNNLMFGMLSYITERIGKDSWENLMRTHIFEPLGMTSSTFTHEADLDRTDIAKPYLDVAENEYRQVSLIFQKEWGELGGSGSIVANADDMSKWLFFQLSGGKNQNGHQVLDEEVLHETHKPLIVTQATPSMSIYQRPVIPVTYYEKNYAMAWKTGFYRGLPMLLHTGTSWGYGALLTLLPTENIGIHMSIAGPDSGKTGRRLVHQYLMDLLLGEQPWLNLTTACSFPEPWATTKTSSKSIPEGGSARLDLGKYAGTYGNYGYGNITILVNKTSLQLKYGERGFWNLFPNGNSVDKFVGEGFDHIWFKTLYNIEFSSSSGEDDVDHVSIGDFDSHLPPLFKRGLKMSESPPPVDSVTCALRQVNGASTTKHLSYFDIFVCCLIFFQTLYLRNTI